MTPRWLFSLAAVGLGVAGMHSLTLSALFAAGGPYWLAYGLAVTGIGLLGMAFTAGWAARSSRHRPEPAGDYEDGPTGARPNGTPCDDQPHRIGGSGRGPVSRGRPARPPGRSGARHLRAGGPGAGAADLVPRCPRPLHRAGRIG